MTTGEKIWVAAGLAGQAFFTARFLVQWIATEKHKKSVVPGSFWYFSIIGSLILLFYAIHRQDPVFILGQSFGMTVYLRNLHFVRREKAHAAG